MIDREQRLAPTMSESDPEVHDAYATPRALERAMPALAKAVGPEYVKTSQADLAAAAKATVPSPKRPLAVVYPGNAHEIVAVMNIARAHGLALWPCSKGKNWGYGSATPASGDTVVLHLERLDRIIEVNEDLAYAVIEPGVTYRQLKRHLEQHHPRLWCDCTDGPPDGSVIGNALDRGLGVTHLSDHFGSLCGLEVVLPDGEIVRTGGGPKDCRTWHTHKWGVGPYLEGIFSQSNYGVVIKAGVWLMPRPEAFCAFQFDLRDEADLPALIDAVRELMLAGTLQAASHIVNEIVALAILTQYPAPLLDRYSRLPDDVVKGMCERYLVRPWSFGGGIQGTSGIVSAVKRELRKRLAPLGTIMFIDDRVVGLARVVDGLARTRLGARPVEWMLRRFARKSLAMLDVVPHVHSVLQGTPSDFFVRHAYFKSRVPKPEIADPDRDNCGLIWFAPIVPMTGAEVRNVLDLCRPLFQQYQFDFYAALLTQNPRSMIVLMAIFFLKESAEQTAKAQALYEALSRATRDAGYQPYRVSTAGMAGLADVAPNFSALARRIKDALDTDRVIAPGKYGI
jgi:4-cresol dehydrogenase (hydroxylating)